MRSLTSLTVFDSNSFYFYFGSFTGLFTYFAGYFWRSLKKEYRLTELMTA